MNKNASDEVKNASSDELPPGYKKGVERVSNIVSFVFPFKGTDGEKRYLDWLKSHSIDEKEYIEEACTVGTYIHQQMEDYIEERECDKGKLSKIHKDTIVHGTTYIKKLKKKWKTNINWVSEPYVLDCKERYQGSVDLVRVNEKTKTVWVYDYKTWGIAKERFGLKNGNTKPYSKLKKVALQMSLYAETYRQKGYKIGGIYAVWLHKSGTYEYALPLHDKTELDTILTAFAEAGKKGNEKTIISITPNNNMEIEILEPTKTYGNVKIKLDLSKDDSGKTTEELLNNAVKTVKYLANKLKD